MKSTESRRTLPAWAGAALLALLAGGLLAGCQPVAVAADPSSYRGAVLTQPQPKPDFTLTDTSGAPFAFRERTDGYVTLLFFGYTSCPDICPLQMANLSAALRKQPATVQSAVKVVFVTTDPARDTPERLRGWLDAFDHDFIGLTGSPAAIAAVEAAAGVAPSRPVSRPDGSYLVEHAAYVIAYGRDNYARVQYPAGVRQEDWAHDLPKLVEGS